MYSKWRHVELYCVTQLLLIHLQAYYSITAMNNTVTAVKLVTKVCVSEWVSHTSCFQCQAAILIGRAGRGGTAAASVVYTVITLKSRAWSRGRKKNDYSYHWVCTLHRILSFIKKKIQELKFWGLFIADKFPLDLRFSISLQILADHTK